MGRLAPPRSRSLGRLCCLSFGQVGCFTSQSWEQSVPLEEGVSLQTPGAKLDWRLAAALALPAEGRETLSFELLLSDLR